MSTRCTIAYDQKDFHFYQECFENENVYLELDGDVIAEHVGDNDQEEA